MRHTEILLGRRFSRQGLHKQASIAAAFRQAKARLKSKPAEPVKASGGSRELVVMQERIDSLLEEVRFFKAQRDGFFEKFATWQNNARTYGRLSVDQLNMPLDRVDRGSSDRARAK
ncbi:hypothetical protein [Tardiphaga sp. P9-11]|uniref:hypothetical protein n=1 Tax=Tardiphaga sp. P9-11 TaxID=2024614 RepID=UPI001561EAEF|nr:hypothetical protein [Tardiphaga sp. P9-11]